MSMLSQDPLQVLNLLMSAERQNNRLLRLFFPREDGPDAHMVANRLDASEEMGRDFRFSVEVLSNRPDIPLKEVMGKMVTIELWRDKKEPRYFNGFVFDFQFIKNDGGFSYYEMLLMPWMAFLKYRINNFLYHGKGVEEQTREILGHYKERDWDIRALKNDEVMTDACQFSESDYNYLHRRWEEKGWSYWYEHRKDGHKLILCGDTRMTDPIDGSGQSRWKGEDPDLRNGIDTFSPIREVASNLYAASSFDFKNPRRTDVRLPSINQQGQIPQLEIYEYAGAYGFKDIAAGEEFIRLRLEEIEAGGKRFEATGNDDCCQAGRTFLLEGHLDPLNLGTGAGDNEFLILQSRHYASNNYETRDGGVAEYQNGFTCIRKKIPWRPGRGFNSTDTRIYGVQTATVVGPAGEEIHTDAYGRVRVQFHWDREGQYDDRSSAWVRVASVWAGSRFGFMSIPRVGQEVIVQFLDGNPDRPLITGRVYNEKNMPPWDLPANKTQTGILTRSSQGGGYDNANAIRFEDKQGAEQLWIHAEKNQDIEVENDETHWVGHDRSKTIDNDETVLVKHDRTETVDNDETITIHHDRSERVDNDETISIGSNRSEDVGIDETISIGNNRTESVGNDETISIASNRTESVGNDETISIGNNRTESVGSTETITIGGDRLVTISGNKTETVMQGKAESIALAKALSIGGGYQTSVGAEMNTTVLGMQTEQIGMSKRSDVAQKYHIKAGSELVISVGRSSLTMKADGTIVLKGNKITVNSSSDQRYTAKGNISMKGRKIQEN